MDNKQSHFNHAMQAFDEIAKENAGKLLARDGREQMRASTTFIFIDRCSNKKQKKRKITN